ncbi:MAG TPA: DUF1329 domain-containing protein [Candidatus Limnocylindrales bacterium]|nr:DUF1329 domain-containing protein [Candidatus Limnocylindrales bacterium]
MRSATSRSLVAASISASLLTASALFAQNDAADGDAIPVSRAGSTEQDYETLRRLLGLPSPAARGDTHDSSAAPAAVQTPPAIPEAEPVAVPTSAPRAEKPVPAARPAAPRRAPRSLTRPPSAAKALSAPAIEAAPAPVDSAPAPMRMPAEKGSATSAAAAPQVAVPPVGTVISRSNLEQWKHLLGPSIQWSVERGATLDVAARKPMPIEPRREQATQRYHAQVRLAANKLSMTNYVAGIPFPLVTKDDPDLVIKLMFNYESRLVADDVDLRRSVCDTGGLSAEQGFHIEKHYEPEHFRRLFYVSRLFHEPMPTWKTVDGVRYREVAGPLSEPFDLKGAGYTYARYLDPARQDDSWVYYPSSRRVRRLSTAQRSEGVFGQDIDLDSFAGFAGNPAWTEWKYLGEKTILAPMHARNVPVKFQASPVDYFPDEDWEPREVHVIVGTSLLVGNSFSRRVLYVDRESLLIPLVELYDMNGGLWKGMLQTWTVGDGVVRAAAPVTDDPPRMASISLFDMQLDHVTRCELPAAAATGERGWYFNEGDEGGTTEAEFEVSGMIAKGR